MREQFPDVRQLSIESLHEWLLDPTRAAPMLLDVRTAPEYRVSRLPGAVMAPDADAALAVLADRPRHAPVVAYCSVGVRSARLVRALRKHGFVNTHNLEGSLFAWANRALPMVNADGPASTVHPFDASWGALLDPARRHVLA